jgi:hypothetical protein
MNRKAATGLTVLGAFLCAGGGWLANDISRARACPAYTRLDVNLNALPEYPLDKVSNDAVGQVQKCWAAHPFEGPQYVLQLVGARQARGGARYLIFQPWGVSDIQLVFSLDAKNRLTGAHAHGTL